MWDARTHEVRPLVPQGGEARYLSSGHLVYGHDGDLNVIGFDLERLEVLGDPRLVVEGVRSLGLGETAFDVADNGTLVYLPGAVQRTEQMKLVWLSPDGASEEEVASGDISFPTISDDGRRWMARTGDAELTLFEQGAPAPLRYSTPAAVDFPPFFLPGGLEVAFGGGRPVWDSHYRLNLGTGAVTARWLSVAMPRVPIGLDGEGAALALLASTDARNTMNFDIGVGDLEGQEPHRPLAAGPRRESFAKLSGGMGGVHRAEPLRRQALRRRLSGDDASRGRRRSIASMGYAWSPEGRLFFTDTESQTMRSATFSRQPELRVAGVETAFLGISSFWAQRSFEIAPDGRLLIIRAMGAAGGAARSGRFRVVLDWMRGEGLVAQ